MEKLLLDSIPFPVFSVNRACELISFNKAYSNFMKNRYGVNIETGHVLSEYYSEKKEWESMQRNLYRALEGEEFVEIEVTNQENKTQKQFEITYGSIQDQHSTITGASVLIRDITDQKDAEKALKESEEKFRKAFITSPDCVSINRLEDGMYMAINEGFTTIFGYTEDEIIGRTSIEKSIWNNLEDRASWVEELNKNGEVRNFERQFRAKNGQIIQGLVSSTFIEFQGVKHVLSITRDITERKIVENALKESETQYRNLANSGLSLIWTSGTDKLCNYFNETWLKFTGRTLEQEIGNGWAEGVHPDDFDRCLETYVSAFDKREAFEMEYRLKHVSGEFRWILDLGTPNYNSKNEFIGYIGNCFDINERKAIEVELLESEWKFKALFDFGPIGVAYHRMIYDAEGKPIDYYFIDANDSYKELTGVNPKGMTVREAFPGIEKDTFDWIGKYGHVVKTGETIRFEQFFETNGRWYDCVSYQYKPDHFVVAFTEITKRKETEIALNESENKYRQLVENSPEAIAIYNEKEIVFVNNEGIRLMGATSASELLGRNVIEFVHPDSHKFVVERIKSALLEGVMLPLAEERFLRLDGSVCEVEVKAIPLIYENKQAVQIIVRDITDRKLAEEALRNSEEMFKKVFEKSIIGKSLTSIDGKLTVNKAFCDIVGYSQEELSGMKFVDITHKDDIELNLKGNNSILNGEKESSHWEKRYIHKTGNIVWVDISTILIRDNDGNPLHFITEVYDITERKTAEETLKLRESYLTAIIENLPGIIWLKDAESHILLSNTKFAHTFGREKPEDLLGKTDLDFSPKEQAERYLADDKKVVNSKKPLHVEELIYDQSGLKWFETFKMPIFDDHNDVIGTTGYAQNVSERKEAEKALLESEEKFKKAFMTSPDSVNINRLEDGLYVSINKGFTNIMGYTEEDVIGKTSIEINIWTNPADREKFVEGLRKTGLVENLATQFKSKNGEIVYGLMSALVIELNGIHHILSITRNITEIKQAEEKLKKSEMLHRTILKTAINGFWMADLNGKILDVNESYSRMSGYSVEELLNMNISEVEVHESASDIQAHIKRIKEHNFDKFETQHRRKDGSVYEVEVSVQYKEGENEMTVSFIRDITVRKKAENALKQSEDKFRSITEQTTDLISINDTNGIILYSSPSSKLIFGLEPEEMIGHNFIDFLDESSIKKALDSFRANIATGQRAINLELKMKRKDGSRFIGELNGTNFEQGDQKGTLVIIRDITERKEAENALKDSKVLLNKLLFSSSEFIDSTIKGVDYSQMTNKMLEISGAKYASFNIIDLKTHEFKTVAMSGLKDIELKAVSFLGFSPINKVWYDDPIRAEKIKDSVITTFDSFNELSGHVISAKIAKLIEKTFNIGKVVVVKIIKDNVAIGDFTLLFDGQKTLQNIEIVELFASQVGLYVVRNQAEEDLRESESKYRILFAENPQPMLVYDLETLDFIEVNQTAMDFYGYSRNEFLCMSITELHQKEEREYFLKMIDLTRKGEITDGIFRHIKKNGDKIFVETHSVPAPIFGKNARNILIQDVTQRKLNEDAIKSSMSLLNASLESTADGILVVDTEGRATIHNHKFAQMWNIPEDILMNAIDEHMLNYVLTQIENPEEFLSNVNYLYKSPELSGIDEVELIDGRIFERYSIPQWIGNSIVGRVWSFRDITERIKAEKALKEKMDEMMRFQKLTVGRELAMIELKKEINKLLDESGLEEKYKIVQ